MNDIMDIALSLFNLKNEDIESAEVRQVPDEMQVFIKLERKPHLCPVCGTSVKKVKGYTKKRITHSILTDRKCVIIYSARRFECPVCAKTFYETNPFVFDHQKISMATVMNILNDLKSPAATFTQIGDRHHVSPTTVSYIFDRHVKIPRRKLPGHLCIDEVYAFHSTYSDYVCVLVDYDTAKVLDVLSSRKKYDLINYFTAIPKNEREAVKIFSSDMWETYRIVGKIVFPNAKHSVDKFHVLQELTKDLDSVRIRVMNRYRPPSNIDKNNLTAAQINEYNQKDTNYYLLKKFNWVLFKEDPKIHDANQEKKYNKKLGRYLNLNDIYRMIMEIDDELYEAVNLKDAIYYFYRNSTYNTAQKDLKKLLKELDASEIDEMKKFAKTMRNWKEEIVNSFIEHDGKKVNNGIIENRNKSIKLIKHSSNGYRNWERFRNRVLYSLNDDTYPYFPPAESKNE